MPLLLPLETWVTYIITHQNELYSTFDPLIPELELRTNIQRQKFKELITPEVRDAAVKLDNSFH